MRRSRFINGMQAHYLHRLGLDPRKHRAMTYRADDCSNCVVNWDAWLVTPKQHRRFHKKLHKAGVFYSGTGMMTTVEFR